MADGTGPSAPSAFVLGEEIEALLDRLETAGLRTGVRERSAVFLIAARWAEGQGKAGAAEVSGKGVQAEATASANAATAQTDQPEPANSEPDIRGLRPLLAPLLARTRDERLTFFQVFDSLFPERAAPKPPPTPRPVPPIDRDFPAWLKARWPLVAGGVGLLVALTVLAATLWPRPAEQVAVSPVGPGASTTEIIAPPTPKAKEAPEVRTIQTSDRLLSRVLAAADDHSGAPTLEAVAEQVFGDEESLGNERPLTISDWGTAEEATSITLSGHENSVISAAFSPDGKWIVTGSLDKTARIWDAQTGALVRTLVGHQGIVTSAEFSPDGKWIVTGSADSTARVWDTATGKPLLTLSGHEGAQVNSASYSPDGTRIITASWDKAARVWNASTGAALLTLSGHESWVNSASFSPDGTRIVTASGGLRDDGDNTARIWDAATGAELRVLAAHEDNVVFASFSPDGTRIVTASNDKTARVWDAATGATLRTLSGHEDVVFSAAFSSDGLRILTASEDKTARLWNAATGEPIGTLEGHEGMVFSAAFSPDGKWIVTGSSDSTARIWSPALAGSSLKWTSASYAERLAELTGLPLGTPLALFGADGKDGAVWARLAQALGRIEQPGQEPPLEQLKAEADSALANVDAPEVYRVAAAVSRLWPDPAALPKTQPEILKALAADADAGTVAPNDLSRALAMIHYPSPEGASRPWAPRPPRPASTAPPGWLPLVAGALPLMCAVWFARALAFRRAHLRRRTPRYPPTHTDLVSNAGRRVAFDVGTFQRAAQRLLVRTPRASAEIDVPATVAATLEAGGLIVTPVWSSARSRPEYLVLIERASLGDQEAERMRQMVQRLTHLVDLDIYHYQTDPAEVEARDGRRISIEQLQSRHPEHRLIILGTGVGFLDPSTQALRKPAQKLAFWERRALLTPIPLAEWSREEYALSEGLQMPVGRATPEGLLALAELLGLDGGEQGARLRPRGDGLARPLPDILRLRPERFLFNDPPDDDTIAEVLRELRNTLDPPAFDWFAALAVYPAIQWDLTLYIGVELARTEGGDPVKDPLYGEDRLAAITQLPWLKAGRMPNWLRRVLIARIPEGRAREIRAVIERAIEAARPKSGTFEDAQLNLRMAKEPPKEATQPHRLMEDEVLVDFLAAGRKEDFSLPRWSKLNELFDRNFWERLGGPEGLAGIAAVAYALAAFGLAPRAADGPVLTGAYAPLWMLALGGLFAMLVWNARGIARRSASLLERAAPGALAMLVAGLILSPVEFLLPVLQGSFPGLVEVARVGGPAFWLALLVAVGFGLLVARFGIERLGVRVFAPVLGTLQGVSLFALHAAFLALVLGVAYSSLLRSPQLLVAFGSAVLATFILGVIAARFAPDARTIAAAKAREAQSGRWTYAARALAAGLPIALAAGFAWHVATSHKRFQLEAPTGFAPDRVAMSADGAVLATSDHSGRIVLTRADGGLIRVVQAQTAAPLTALAVGGEAAAPVLAFADADGVVFEQRGGAPAQVVKAPGTGAPVQSLGLPAHLAFGPNASLASAVERNGATQLLLSGKVLDVDVRHGPPAALAALGEAGFALATQDGSLFQVRTTGEGLEARLVSAAGDSASTTPAPAAGESGAVAEVATDRAPARYAMFDAANRQLRLVAVDGALELAALKDGQLGPPVAAGRNVALALGSTSNWRADIRVLYRRGIDLLGDLKIRPTDLDENCARSSCLDELAQIMASIPFNLPVDAEYKILSGYGRSVDPFKKTLAWHSGVDLGAYNGAPIIASASGVIVFSGVKVGYGRSVDIDHGFDLRTRYGHLANIKVTQGERVSAKQLIGSMGATGRADGPQLHYEVHFRGKVIDPAPFLRTESAVQSWAADVALILGRTPSGFERLPDPEIFQSEPLLTPGTTFRDTITASPGTPVPEMVVVPAGSFMMGSPASEAGRHSDEGPQRRVAIGKPFAVGKYEVTWAEYDACVAAKACPAAQDDGYGKGSRPVTNVSWNDAKAYAAWLTAQTGQTYRLLSETEWEYAARAGTTTPFSFGATISTAQANYNGNYTYGNGAKGEYRRKTTPVGQFPANAFGLHDLHGNVGEWVEDCWEGSYSAGQPSDGSAFTKGSCSDRVTRGGSWSNFPQNLRSAYRYGSSPDARYSSLGFRVARTP